MPTIIKYFLCTYWWELSLGCHHGLINYIDNKAICCHLKQLTCKGTLRQLFICLRPPPLLGFCFGWCSNFVGSESGQIQSVKLLQNMVSNRILYPPPPYTLHTDIQYTYSHREGGELNQREGWRGDSSQSGVENTNNVSLVYKVWYTPAMYLWSIKYDTHLPQVNFFRWRQFHLVSM